MGIGREPSSAKHIYFNSFDKQICMQNAPSSIANEHYKI